MNETATTPDGNHIDHGSATHLLVTPGFVIALLILAANDHILKAAYGNWITGKLSDFAGLFAFALFLCALQLQRRTSACIATGIAFVVWKSPLSEPLLTAWNGLGIWPVNRTLDSSDLIALCVLPPAWWYAANAAPTRPWRALKPLSAMCAILLFAATSRARYAHPDGTKFVSPYDVATVKQAFRILEMERGGSYIRYHVAEYVFIRLDDREIMLALNLIAPDSTELTITDVTTYEKTDPDALLRSTHKWFTDSVFSRINATGEMIQREASKRR